MRLRRKSLALGSGETKTAALLTMTKHVALGRMHFRPKLFEMGRAFEGAIRPHGPTVMHT